MTELLDLPEGAEFGRRFNAVIIRDGRFRKLSDLAARCPTPRFGRSERLEGQARPTSLFRVQLLSTRFSYTTLDEPASDLKPHLGYIAFYGAGQAATTLLVSPFKRLLGQVVRDVVDGTDPPVEGFFRFDIGQLMAKVREGSIVPVEDVSAVTLRVTGDDQVDLVRLTGHAPLVSSLLSRLESDEPGFGAGAIPYGVVIRLGDRLNDPVRLGLDRHGNVYWYQRGEPAIGAVVGLMQRLEGAGSIITVDRRVPVHQTKLSDP